MNDAIVRGNTAFALDLYRRQPAGNVFFSPYSISTAMAMTAAGARGETAAEIERALRFPCGGAALADAWPALREAAVIAANALWTARDIALRAAYVELARRAFGAMIETLDFSTDAARLRINAWVGEVTRGKIPRLVEPGLLGADTRMVLTNAIYMKAAWALPFESALTNLDGRFFTEDGEVAVPLMFQTNRFRYVHDGGVKVIELPYAGYGLSMLVVLPDAIDGLERVELTPETIARWSGALEPRPVSVALPRFRCDIGMELGRTLRAMGIRLAFDPDGAADFSGISESEQISISEVIHQARIDVTERGTEAAAATAVVMRAAAAQRQEAPPELFHADHPFFFAIRRVADEAMLFVGRMAKPA